MKLISLKPSVRYVILILSILYFIAFIPVNLQGSKSNLHRDQTSLDENLQYSFLVRMLTPGKTWNETISHLVDHLHYIYGYPFYVFNALVVLPVRLIGGDQFAESGQWMLLILRQMISIAPVMVAVLILIWLQSGKRYNYFSLFIAGFIFIVPGVVRQNIQWWHPDGLVIFFSALTFYFLIKDDHTFGKNFYFAALSTGLASAIKLIGFFFFLAIAWYLVSGIIRKKIDIRKTILLGSIFLVIVVGTYFFTNPMWFFEKSRQLIIKTQLDHNYAFSHGWETGDVYDLNPLSWLPVLQKWYAEICVLLICLLVCVIGCFRGRQKLLNQLIFFWILPLSVYLSLNIAVRPDHYWLPIMIPLFSSLVQIRYYLENEGMKRIHHPLWKKVCPALLGVIVIGLFFQMGRNVFFSIRLYNNALQTDRLIEACSPNPIQAGGSLKTSINPAGWYLVEEFDLLESSSARSFAAVQGSILSGREVTPGMKIYICVGYEEARFKAAFLAQDYKYLHPDSRVIGPDGNMLLSPMIY